MWQKSRVESFDVVLLLQRRYLANETKSPNTGCQGLAFVLWLTRY